MGFARPWMDSILVLMSARLQVILSEEEMTSLRQAARRTGLTVSEWARQALRRARAEQAGVSSEIAAFGAVCRPTSPATSLRGSTAQIPGAESRLRALERALACDHPTGDIDEMLADIARGRGLR